MNRDAEQTEPTASSLSNWGARTSARPTGQEEAAGMHPWSFFIKNFEWKILYSGGYWVQEIPAGAKWSDPGFWQCRRWKIWLHGVLSNQAYFQAYSVNFGGKTFLPENMCMKNWQNARILHNNCPQKIFPTPMWAPSIESVFHRPFLQAPTVCYGGGQTICVYLLIK